MTSCMPCRVLLGFFALALFACDDDSPHSKAEERVAAAAPSTAQPTASPVDTLLDGSSNVTLHYTSFGGGPVLFEQELARHALGFAHVAVRGNGELSCSLDGVAYTQILDRDAAVDLVDALGLAELANRPEEEGTSSGCNDASSERVRFGARVLEGSRCGAPEGAYFVHLFERFSALARTCGEGRTPFAGAARYAARPFEGAADASAEAAFRGAPTWPSSLSLEAALAAPPEGLLAIGDGATWLRAARARTLRGEVANGGDLQLIPFVSADGTRYRLGVSDAPAVD